MRTTHSQNQREPRHLRHFTVTVRCHTLPGRPRQSASSLTQVCSSPEPPLLQQRSAASAASAWLEPQRLHERSLRLPPPGTFPGFRRLQIPPVRWALVQRSGASTDAPCLPPEPVSQTKKHWERGRERKKSLWLQVTASENKCILCLLISISNKILCHWKIFFFCCYLT